MSYLCHCTSSEEVCTDLHFIQVDFLENHSSLFLLSGELPDLFDGNIFRGNDSLIYLTKVPATKAVPKSKLRYSPLFRCAPADRIEDIEVCNPEEWAGSGAKEIPYCLQDVARARECNDISLLTTWQAEKHFEVSPDWACLTPSRDSPCQVGCNAIAEARSVPSMLTVGCMNDGDTVARTLLASWIDELKVYRPLAITFVTPASQAMRRGLCLLRAGDLRQVCCKETENGLPVQLGTPLLQLLS